MSDDDVTVLALRENDRLVRALVMLTDQCNELAGAVRVSSEAIRDIGDIAEDSGWSASSNVSYWNLRRVMYCAFIAHSSSSHSHSP